MYFGTLPNASIRFTDSWREHASTPVYRKKSEQNMFEPYYFEFRKTILQSDVQSVENDIPSYAGMLKDYRECRLYGMINALFYLSIYYVKHAILAKRNKNPTMIEQWFFHHRFNLIEQSL